MAKNKDKKKILIKPKIRITIIQVLCIIIMLGILAAPIVWDYMTQHKSDEMITTYSQHMTIDPEKNKALKTEAEAYNARLANEPYDPNIVIPKEEDLIVSGGLPFAWIDFPIFDERIPIYHGVSLEVLQQGVGHLPETSIPVGGPSTHSVLTGHSGLHNTRMFDNLDELQNGDIFYIHILNETLAYKVYDRDIVLPEDTSSLKIQKGRDLCSLITCYPYGVNTHRLIIHAERTDYQEIEPELVPGSFVNDRTYPFLIAAAIVLLALLLWWRRYPKEINHNAKGMKRFKRHDHIPILPILPAGIYEYVHNRRIFRISEENCQKSLKKIKLKRARENLQNLPEV